jgi:hypothetical protein
MGYECKHTEEEKKMWAVGKTNERAEIGLGCNGGKEWN